MFDSGPQGCPGYWVNRNQQDRITERNTGEEAGSEGPGRQVQRRKEGAMVSRVRQAQEAEV